jgi:hypothetical protein
MNVTSFWVLVCHRAPNTKLLPDFQYPPPNSNTLVLVSTARTSKLCRHCEQLQVCTGRSCVAAISCTHTRRRRRQPTPWTPSWRHHFLRASTPRQRACYPGKRLYEFSRYTGLHGSGGCPAGYEHHDILLHLILLN